MLIVFHLIMVGAFVVLGVWALTIFMQALIVFGRLFRAHMPFFLLLWFYLPVVALWLNTQAVRSEFSLFSRRLLVLKVMRVFLVAAVVLLSLAFGSYINQAQIRPFVAQLLHISTVHWYFDVLELAFQLALAGTCVALPYVTWCATNHAVDEAIQGGSARARDQGTGTLGDDEPWYVTEEEAIRAHAIREKKPDEQSK